MKCPRCNADLVAEARFCGTCGYSLSVLEDHTFQADPSSLSPRNNEATLIATPQPIQSAGGTPGGGQAPASAQAGGYQATQAVSWQQPSPQMQTQIARPTGMVAGTMASAGTLAYPVKRRRGGRILRRILLVLVLLAALLAAAWVFAVRPYLHNMVQTQLDQALNGAEGQIILFQSALPGGSQVVHVSEGAINTYLSVHSVSPLQNLHATITPDGLRLDFSAYGLSSDIIVVPVARGGALEVTNVQVQGILWLVMSDDELTTALNTNFQSFGQQMNRTIRSITLHEHEMDVQIQ
jgi:hypothetical protein